MSIRIHKLTLVVNFPTTQPTLRAHSILWHSFDGRLRLQDIMPPNLSFATRRLASGNLGAQIRLFRVASMEGIQYVDSQVLTSTSLTPTSPLEPNIEDLLDGVSRRLSEMAVDHQTQVFVDGTFEDLADELAGYIDNVKKMEESEGVRAEIKPLLDSNKKDEALKKLVTASPVLNSAPEKEFTAAYNLLIYLIIQSPNVNMFLPKVCENLSRPITSSPINGTGLALSVLTTLFNLLKPDNEVRYNVFQAILRLVKTSGLYEMLRPQLKKLDTWMKQWDVDEEDQRKLFGQIADVAEDAGEEE
jgi:hypothetical protein